jgi:putative ABC transport system permease protein
VKRTSRVSLAGAEMRRGRVRFGLLSAAVGLLVFLILFQQALLGALVTDFVGALRNQSARVLVFGAEARRNVEGSVVPAGAVEAVSAVDGVADAGPLGEGTFTVRAGGRLADAVLFGYRLGGPGAPTTLSAGRFPRTDGEAVASRGDAGRGFRIGSRVKVEPGGPAISIVGLADDARYSVAPTMFVSFATFEAAARARNPDARAVRPSLVAVEPAPGVDPGALARRIAATVDGVEVLTRGQAVDASPGVAAVRSSFSVVLALAYAVVGLVTGFFFLILTVQKTAALTLLRALGAPAGLLVRSLVIQVGVVVVVGVFVATALLALAGVLGGSGVSVTVSIPVVAASGAAVLVLGGLSALAAVRRILRLDPMAAAAGGTLGGLR